MKVKFYSESEGGWVIGTCPVWQFSLRSTLTVTYKSKFGGYRTAQIHFSKVSL